MIVVFGKWKVGNWISHLLTVLSLPHVLMDDEDFDTHILADADTILISPGIKQSHLIYTNYASKIKSELNFLGSLLPTIGFATEPTWIGVTATNGKSTTTWIGYLLLKQLFPNRHVWITWNFDIPISEILATIIENNQLHEPHIFVVECSSFMLYGLENFTFDFGLLLNIARDHLDWHKDWEEYRESKFNLLKASRTCIVSHRLYEELDLQTQTRSKFFYPVFDLSKTQFLGSHNQENFAAVALALETYYTQHDLPFDSKRFYEILATIPPLDHRLKLLRTLNGIAFYDDGICTSSQALHAALDAFYQPLVLMAWGYDKWDDYHWLHNDFVARVRYAVLFGQTAPKFQVLCEQNNIPFVVVDNLHDAVQKSYLYAKEHHIELVLFSPGAASFDMFKNVYDRVGQFVHEVSLLA